LKKTVERPVTMSDELSCPACNSSNVTRGERKNVIRVRPFGDQFTVSVANDLCGICGEEGDFEGKNDAIVEAALDERRKQVAKEVIEELQSKGLSMAECERAFGLPPRTMARWKTGSLTESALALLASIKTLPWLVQVAQENFSKEAAEREVLAQARALVATESSSSSVLVSFLSAADVQRSTHYNESKVVLANWNESIARVEAKNISPFATGSEANAFTRQSVRPSA